MDTITWERIDRLRAWLDDNAGDRTETEQRLLRVLKIGEEFGEASEALHGALAANPRKGASHDWDDVRKELSDVIVTAMVALATVSDDPAKALDDRLRHLVERVHRN
ncbi:MazG-like family protein [Streptomyces sp. LP05-1]|uniref:MazG-like family protein n=1 Tax=Streptomyces pyxinae TaxID=2970734 RepID=A0ABT2CBM5_9ACTN|nr:MazG-like family protein [Streptomyces sp. LP05-1]MCS0634725.1 MazG-like family protein [Streptomyces sp. LP05-1]